MITGRIIADGVDLKSTYGAYVVEGGYVDIPCFPEIKQPEINDWYEYNGIEVDLTSLHVRSQEVRLNLKMHGSSDEVLSLLNFLLSKRTREFSFVDVDRTRTMRVDSASARHYSLGLFDIYIILCDDSPANGIEYGERSQHYYMTGLELDDVDLSSYGIMLTGSIDGLYPTTTIKDNILSDTATIDGDIHYDGDIAVTVDKDDISVRCVMKAKTISSFWTKRDCLLLDLIKDGQRTLSFNGNTSRVYYKDCRSIMFSYYNSVWWEFELIFGYIGGAEDDGDL